MKFRGCLDSTHCLCGIHVHTAARIIALKSMIFAVFKSCFLFFFKSNFRDMCANETAVDDHVLVKAYLRFDCFYQRDGVLVAEMVSCAVFAVVAIVLFYGNSQRKPAFYLPYLGYSFLELVQALINLGFLAALIVRATHIETNDEYDLLYYTIGLTVAFLLFYILRTYLLFVVIIQARRYLVEWRRHKKGASKLQSVRIADELGEGGAAVITKEPKFT